MDNIIIIIRKNLRYQGKEDEFFNYVSKGTFIYSFITMSIALISGFIFNLNNYLPMYITSEKHHEKLSMYFFLIRKFINFTFNLLISLILLKLDLKYAIIFLIIIVTFTLYISFSITKMVK